MLHLTELPFLGACPQPALLGLPSMPSSAGATGWQLQLRLMPGSRADGLWESKDLCGSPISATY